MNYNDSSFYLQLRELQHFVAPVADSDLTYTVITELDTVNGVPDFRIDEYTKLAGAQALNPKDFTVMLAKSLSTDYRHESADPWVILVAIVIIVVITYFTWGTGTAAGISTAAALGIVGETAVAIVVFMSALSLGLSMSLLVLSLVTMAMQKHGDYGNAIAMQGVMVMLGKVTKILGYVVSALGVGAIMILIS